MEEDVKQSLSTKRKRR